MWNPDERFFGRVISWVKLLPPNQNVLVATFSVTND